MDPGGDSNNTVAVSSKLAAAACGLHVHAMPSAVRLQLQELLLPVRVCDCI
jgi:hypothetical protein